MSQERAGCSSSAVVRPFRPAWPCFHSPLASFSLGSQALSGKGCESRSLRRQSASQWELEPLWGPKSGGGPRLSADPSL